MRLRLAQACPSHRHNGANRPRTSAASRGTDLVPIAPFGAKVSTAVKDLVAQTAADLEFGKRVVFAGPLADQGVKIRIAEGETFTDDAMGSLDWFVEGVLGSPK